MSAEFNPSKLTGSFAESATLALAAKAKKMAAEGKSIKNFAAGEPDFNTPDSVIEAAYRAAKGGATKYTAVPGKPSLREAIAKRIAADYGIEVSSPELMVSNGGKQSIFHFLQATLEPGDEVLIQRPYWTSFPEMVKIVGGKPVFFGLKDGRPDLSEMESRITEKTRLFIYNSPGNPSGLVWNESEIKEMLALLKPSRAWLLSDDTYYALTYSPAEFVSPLKIDPSFRERTCIVGAASKSYSMTGWRLGWAIAPEPIIKAMSKLQGQVTSGPCSLSQAAAEEAVGASHSASEGFREKFDERRKLLMGLLEGVGKLRFLEPHGAFYLFIDFSQWMPKESVTGFCSQLLDEHGVCIVPGEAFGEPAYARMSYAASEEDLREGVKRLEKALNQL